MPYTVAAFYRFLALPNPAALRDTLRATFAATDLCGSLLIAPEGINGTLAASPETIDDLLAVLATHTGLTRDEVKFSHAEERPFGRLKFLLKKEIIAFRTATSHTQNATENVPTEPGRYVDPADWNALIADPSVLVLDTRNTYETEVGTFANAVDPHIDTFSGFATWVRKNLSPATTPRVAMYCTGGIRCEKASAFMLQQGFPEVYHLRGGILKYIEEVPATESQWQGDCFVFDRRRAVGHADFAAGIPASDELNISTPE